MPDQLQALIDSARLRPFSLEERDAQRRSFAYGNTKIENDLITREMVDEQDRLLQMDLKARPRDEVRHSQGLEAEVISDPNAKALQNARTVLSSDGENIS